MAVPVYSNDLEKYFKSLSPRVTRKQVTVKDTCCFLFRNQCVSLMSGIANVEIQGTAKCTLNVNGIMFEYTLTSEYTPKSEYTLTSEYTPKSEWQAIDLKAPVYPGLITYADIFITSDAPFNVRFDLIEVPSDINPDFFNSIGSMVLLNHPFVCYQGTIGTVENQEKFWEHRKDEMFNNFVDKHQKCTNIVTGRVHRVTIASYHLKEIKPMLRDNSICVEEYELDTYIPCNEVYIKLDQFDRIKEEILKIDPQAVVTNHIIDQVKYHFFIEYVAEQLKQERVKLWNQIWNKYKTEMSRGSC